jgi:hypothetical protein
MICAKKNVPVEGRNLFLWNQSCPVSWMAQSHKPIWKFLVVWARKYSLNITNFRMSVRIQSQPWPSSMGLLESEVLTHLCQIEESGSFSTY